MLLGPAKSVFYLLPCPNFFRDGPLQSTSTFAWTTGRGPTFQPSLCNPLSDIFSPPPATPPPQNPRRHHLFFPSHRQLLILDPPWTPPPLFSSRSQLHAALIIGRSPASPSPDWSSRSCTTSGNASSVSSSSEKLPRDHGSHAPRGPSRSLPSWPQPTRQHYCSLFAPVYLSMSMQPTMIALLPVIAMPAPMWNGAPRRHHATGPSDRTRVRENQRLRRKVRRRKQELKQTLTSGMGNMQRAKRLKVSAGRRVAEVTDLGEHNTVRRNRKWLAASAPKPHQAP